MDKRLSRWTARILVLIILMSFVTWSTAEETSPSGPEGSETSVTVQSADLSQYKTLTVGYTGPEVAALKQGMYELGYFNNNTVNESFTATTAEYVKKFEQINGLPVDGVADPEMQALFFSDKARKVDGTPAVPDGTAYSLYAAQEMTEEEKQINQRFINFLADVGEYSDKTIETRLYRYRDDLGKHMDLGFVYANTYENSTITVFIQGILLHHFNSGGEEILAVGLKNRKGGRIIVAICFPVRHIISTNPLSAVDVGVNGRSFNFARDEHFYSEEEISAEIDRHINAVLGFLFLGNPQNSENTEKEEYTIKLYDFLSVRADANRALLAGIRRPPESSLDKESRSFLKALKGRTNLVAVSDYQGFISVVNQRDTLPYVFMFTYQRLQ